NDGEVELMTKMSVEGNRPLNWNVLTIDSARPEAYLNQISACEKANDAGANHRYSGLGIQTDTRSDSCSQAASVFNLKLNG
ncbi:MAG: hypothetical protein ACO3DT_03795, partial [Gammaproteobacteria bacterium]